MKLRSTVIGFYDSMGPQAVDYCFKQTNLASIFCSKEYLLKLLNMKKEGLALPLKNIVLFDTDKDFEANAKECADLGINVYTFNDVIETGKSSSQVIKEDEVSREDVFMLNYTSGTTGDPKGVKVNQWGYVANAYMANCDIQVCPDDTIISYLPSPHVFDQVMFGMVLASGGRIGYYQGDPLKLTLDCQVLQPTIFPSVPRLYNKIYAKINQSFSDLPMCKRWLANTALSTKLANLQQSARYSHGCYDALVFNKVKKTLGGRVRAMVTASAPISKEVLEFFKVCFGVPVYEAYGLSETHGAATLTKKDDPVSG